MAKDELRAGVVHFSGDEVSALLHAWQREDPRKSSTSARAEGAMLRTASSPSKRSEPAGIAKVARGDTEFILLCGTQVSRSRRQDCGCGLLLACEKARMRRRMK